MLPTFLLIGAKKAGSTSLWHYVRGHPEVFMPEVKRLDFFSGGTWDRGVSWYRDQFAGAGGALARGEASNTYSHHPVVQGVPERIASVVPEVRLVYLVRHPIDRIVSHYGQAVGEWGRTGTFEEVVLGNRGEFVAPSRYAMQIERYLQHFSRDQLLVVVSEDLRDRRGETLESIFRFLGVDPHWLPPDVERRYTQGTEWRTASPFVHRLRRSPVWRTMRRRVPSPIRKAGWMAASRQAASARHPVELSKETRHRLVEELRPDVERLSQHLGTGFHGWGLLGDG